MIEHILPYITAGGAVIATFVTVLNYRQARRAREASEHAKDVLIEVDGKVVNLGRNMDGALTRLLESKDREARSAADLARSEGHAAGEQAQRDRASDSQA